MGYVGEMSQLIGGAALSASAVSMTETPSAQNPGCSPSQPMTSQAYSTTQPTKTRSAAAAAGCLHQTCAHARRTTLVIHKAYVSLPQECVGGWACWC